MFIARRRSFVMLFTARKERRPVFQKIMNFQALYTTVIGKECPNPECPEFGHRKPRKSFPLCQEDDCGFVMEDVRRLSLPKIIIPPLLLILLAIILYIPNITFLGLSIENRAFIVILDISSSMSSVIPIARQEAKTILDEHRKKWGILWRYADVIYFDNTAQSALGAISKLDDSVVDRLKHSLDQARTGGGTRLQAAIEMAAREVVAYGKPTTLLIVTDGGDNSIPAMLRNIEATKALFQGIEVNAHSTTPRILQSPTWQGAPAGPNERNLQQFSYAFGGKFGGAGETGGCASITTLFQ